MPLNLEQAIRRSIARKLYLYKYEEMANDHQLILERVGSVNNDYIRNYQLKKFNQRWAEALESIEYYRRLAELHGLPKEFRDISEVYEFPVLRKEDLAAYFSHPRSAHGFRRWMSTGGSTGSPLRFPVDGRNAQRAIRNSNAGRLASGLAPWDRVALVWGHSHLFGAGFQGRVNYLARIAIDWFTNTRRFNAYNLDEASLNALIQVICTKPFDAVIGYSSVLRAILTRLLEHDTSLSALAPRTWIMTSEQYEQRDFDLVSSLGSEHKLLIEYGSAEFGAIAYSSPGGSSLSAFWWSFITRINESGELFVYDLDSTAFPFFNYPTGDLVELPDRNAQHEWKRIVGRKNDNISISLIGGTSKLVHSELLSHCIKTDERVKAFQVAEHDDRTQINLSIASSESLPDVSSKIIDNMRKEISNIDVSKIVFTEQYERKTLPSGKEKFIFRHDDMS